MEHPQDLTVISRLADEILDRLPRVRDEADRWSWEDYVLRRTAPAWQLARACALCLDSYVEGLAGGHMGLRAQAGADQDHRERLEQLIQGLLAVSETLRDAIDRRTAEVEARGKQPLLWAQRLTALELDALVLSGLTASGRLRSGVSLGLLDDRSIEVVRDAAGRVRDDARATRRSTWFDSEAVSAWAAAIAYDALELCGSRLARVGLRRSIGVLEANSMRKLTVTQTGRPATRTSTTVTWRRGGGRTSGTR